MLAERPTASQLHESASDAEIDGNEVVTGQEVDLETPPSPTRNMGGLASL